ncbi:MAG: thioredoxin reductase [Verrucomicrobiota bacterium]|nr:MAG: thioredoxin reductase [Verrucomicrobiota bacterium]
MEKVVPYRVRLRRTDCCDLHRPRKSRALVLTGAMPGGLLTTTSIVENYPGFAKGIDGTELMMEMQQQAEGLGRGNQFGSRWMQSILAGPIETDRGRQRGGDADGWALPAGRGTGISGWRARPSLGKKGVTYCATCEGRCQSSAISRWWWSVGRLGLRGGDLSNPFCFKCLPGSPARRTAASKIMAERTLTHEKIEPVWNSEVTEVLDAGQDKVTGVKVRNNQTGDESTLDCAGLFIAIGHVPNTQLFRGVIDMDDAGYILPKRGQETNVAGVFVAGDCSDHVYRQAVTAAGQGCAAAIEAERYLASLDQ